MGSDYSGTDWYCDRVFTGELEVDVVHDDADVLAFHTPFPFYEHDVVVVPRRHVASLTTADPSLCAKRWAATLDRATLTGIAVSTAPHTIHHTPARDMAPKGANMTVDHWIRIVEEIGPRIAVGADERDANDTFVGEHYALLREHGLLTMLVPSELGGWGASHRTTAAVLRRLARHDPSTALALAMHQHLVAAQVFNHRAGKERATATLRRVAAEGLVLVSTGARDWQESNGEMAQVEGGWRVTARKAFASGSPAGDVLVTSAPWEHPTEGWQVLHFAVPMSADGVQVGDDWVAHGMRGTGSQTVTLRDVFVPEAAVALARPRDGFHPVWNVVITVAMPLITAVYVGIAERACELAVPLVDGRDPLAVGALGEARSQCVLARTALARMVDLAADLDFAPTVERSDEILILKTAAVTASRAAVEAAVEVAGGRGFYRRTGLERLLRDVRAGHYHPLPERAQRQFTGRLALGLSPV